MLTLSSPSAALRPAVLRRLPRGLYALKSAALRRTDTRAAPSRQRAVIRELVPAPRETSSPALRGARLFDPSAEAPPRLLPGRCSFAGCAGRITLLFHEQIDLQVAGMTIIATAVWEITSPDLPKPAVLCWPHTTEITQQHPGRVAFQFLFDCLTAPKSCDACVAGVPINRDMTGSAAKASFVTDCRKNQAARSVA